MISAVIATLNDERRLGETLAALVPAAMDGFVREVVIADGGSTDATLTVADDAGARIMPGAALADACASALGPWLLILSVGARLHAGWELAADAHIRRRPEDAGWFDRGGARLVDRLGGILGGPNLDPALLVAKSVCAGVAWQGSHRDLARRLGRSRLRGLGAAASMQL